MKSPQSSNTARGDFIKSLENLKASIQKIEHKIPMTSSGLHAASAQGPNLGQDKDTSKYGKINEAALHGRNHQSTREAETVSHTQQNPPPTKEPNGTEEVTTTQADKKKTPSLFDLPDFGKRPPKIRALMTKSIAPFKKGMHQIEDLLQKLSTTPDTAQRINVHRSGRGIQNEIRG